MRLSYPTVFVATLGLAGISSTFAWGAAGHEIVATIAQIHLHPSVLPVLCDILNPPTSRFSPASYFSSAYPPCHLASIASWADKVRGSPAYRYTAPLHYVGALDDFPGESCAFPGPRGWAGRRDMNVLAAVGNKTAIFADFLSGEQGLQEGEEALKFLVHFVGDMHMPLHLTGRERGGNGAKVTFDGRVTNLHSVWDNMLIAQALRTIPSNYSRPFHDAPGVEAHLRGAIYDPYVRRIMHEGFGVGEGPSMNAGRFSEIDEWLSCPSNPGTGARPVWSTLVGMLQKAQSVFGFGLRLEGRSELQKRHRAMRPKDGRETPFAKRSWRTEMDEDRWDDDVLCPYAWASDIHTLNCELPIWPAELDAKAVSALLPEIESHHDCAGDLDAEMEIDTTGRPRPHPELVELDTPAYAGQIRAQWVVERLLAMAGIRLAGILNGIVLGSEDGLAARPMQELSSS